MKNITKLKFITTVLSASVLILTLAGCTDMAGSKAQEKNQQTVEKSYTVSGRIFFDGTTGAAPKELVNAMTAKTDTSARAATTSFALPEGYSYVVKAKKLVSDSGTTVTWDENNPVKGTVSAENGSISYSIKLTKTGKWNIVFSIEKIDNPGTTLITSGDTIINLNNDYVLVDDNGNTLNSVDIKLKPSYTSVSGTEPFYETSSVKLTVSKAQFQTGSDQDIEKVIWNWQGMYTAYANGTQLSTEVNDWMEGIYDWVYSQTSVEKSFEDKNSVTFEFDNVPACSFNVCLSFVTAEGKYLQIYEDINVFKNFVTDTWYGQNDYFEQNENGQYNLVITPDLLKNAGESMVLYNYNNQGFDYFTTNDLALVNKDIQSNISHAIILPATDFCFGSAGLCYFLYSFPDQELGKWQITSNAYVYTEPISVTGNMPVPSFIAYDQGTKKLYALNYKDNTMTIYEVNNLKDSTKFTKYQYTTAEINLIDCTLKDFVVNDNVAYFAFENDTKGSNELHSTWKTDISLAQINLSEYDEENTNYVTSFFSKQYDHFVTINDMLYQDEKIYLLINHDQPTYNNVIYSTGEIYMLDLSDTTYQTYRSRGYAQSTINTIKTGIISSLENGNIFYSSYGSATDLSSGIPVVHEFQNVSIQLYAPYSDSGSIDTTHFAGPQKFVAIKPKKLVITDAGIALYKDDDGVTKYKEVNRVVYVNIEDLSFSDSVDVDLQLLESYNQPNLSIWDTLGNSISRYIWNSGSGTFNQLTPPETIYAHIIKED